MAFEFRFLDFLQTLRTPVGDAIVPLITYLGEFGAVWIVLAITLLITRKYRRAGAIVAVALVLDLIICNGILKNIFMRTRPCDINTSIKLIIPHPSEYSFPSGHSAASFAAASALLFAGRVRMAIGAFILATLIAFTRLYLYVHFPTDVLGGALAGVLAGFLACKLVTFIEKKRVVKCQK